MKPAIVEYKELFLSACGQWRIIEQWRAFDAYKCNILQRKIKTFWGRLKWEDISVDFICSPLGEPYTMRWVEHYHMLPSKNTDMFLDYERVDKPKKPDTLGS